MPAGMDGMDSGMPMFGDWRLRRRAAAWTWEAWTWEVAAVRIWAAWTWAAAWGAVPAMGGGLGDEFTTPGELGPVAKWRIEQQERVSAKAAKASEAEAAKIAEAQAALQEFYAERADKVSKRAAETRAAEATYVEERDAAMIADSWESVCKLVDLKEKAGQTVDTSRMRSLLTQLKHV